MYAADSRQRLAPWLAVLFLTIWGAKLWVIQIYGTDVPCWDQWDEAQNFFKPWLEGRLTWQDWLASHNEHRIFFTRLLDAGELWLNGQWDPRLEMVVNAGLHAGFACGLAGCLWFFTGRKNAGLICVLLAPLFGLPFGAENTIHGFQSAMYFVEIFSLAAMLGLAFCRAGSGGWWAGLAAAVAAIFTMGSGFFAGVVVLGLLLCRWLQARRVSRNEVLAAVAVLGVVGLGLALNSPSAENQQFHARSIGFFGQALGANLAWPFGDQVWLVPLLWLPLLILLVACFRGRIQNQRAAELAFLLAGWGLLQAAALAFGRARMVGSSRYADVLSLLPIANLACLLVLRENPGWCRWSPTMRSFLAVAWSGLLLVGIWESTQTIRSEYLPWSRTHELMSEKSIRAFVAVDSPDNLTNQLGSDVTYPKVARVQAMLRDESILSILPPACRRPLKLETDAPAAGGFVRPGAAPELPPPPATATWGSYTTNGAGQTGTFLSQPLHSRFPRLMLPVGCGDSLAGLRLQLIEGNGRAIELTPKVTGRWETLIVATPPGPFRLQISDTNPAAWIAVGDITEAGPLTVAALRLTNLAVPMLLAGLLGFGLLAARRWCQSPQSISERLILPVVVLALAGVWRGRNVDGAAVAGRLEHSLAQAAANRGDWPKAAEHWRDTLYFQPADREALCALAELTLTNSALTQAEAGKLAAAYYQAAAKLKPDPAAPPKPSP